jgi:hypothetical protein
VAFGDPAWFSWLYQPAIRTLKVSRPLEADAPFVRAGHPALAIDDSPAPVSWRTPPPDTKEALDIDAFARAGQAVQGVLLATTRVARGPASEPTWFVAFGRVLGAGLLLTLGALSLVPGLWRAFRAGGPGLVARLVQSLGFVALLWRHPVPALWVLLVPNLLSALGSFGLSLLGLAGALSLAATGLVWWRRGIMTGLWLQPWEVCLLVLALALSLVPSTPPKGKPRFSTIRGKSLPKPGSRRPRAR